MLRASISVGIFGAYLLGMGYWAARFPIHLMNTLMMPTEGDIYIRCIGVIAMALALYYLDAVRRGDIHFMRLTVVGRGFGWIGFSYFWLMGWAPLGILLIGTVDLLGAISTGWALWKDSQVAAAKIEQKLESAKHLHADSAESTK
jgi:hypothetical protein